MKKILVLLSFIALAVNAQDIWSADLYASLNIVPPPRPARKATTAANINFEVNSLTVHPVKKSALMNPSKLGDFFEYYPSSWIEKYESVQVTTTSNGKSVTARSTDDKLTVEQQKLLQNLDINAQIKVIIYYKSRNVITEEMESRIVQRLFTVGPEQEARYTGGEEAMRSYLNEHAVQMIVGDPLELFKQATVIFTVDPQGKTTNIRIQNSSGIYSTDQFLLKAIEKMPLWKPAINVLGERISQDYEFDIRAMTGEGC